MPTPQKVLSNVWFLFQLCFQLICYPPECFFWSSSEIISKREITGLATANEKRNGQGTTASILNHCASDGHEAGKAKIGNRIDKKVYCSTFLLPSYCRI